LKPQSFLRHLARHILPFDEGVVLDPFAGSGSTIAACLAVGVESIGVEKNLSYYGLAVKAVPALAALHVGCQASNDYEVASAVTQPSLLMEQRSGYGA
jgi:site-specific DNA-methyltransferase (adenine-specific)